MNIFPSSIEEIRHVAGAKVIFNIIKMRDYDVPRQFIWLYVDKYVIKMMLSDSNDLWKTPELIIEDRLLECKVERLLEIVRLSIDYKSSLNLSSKFMMETMTDAAAVRILNNDNQWKKYMKVKKRRVEKTRSNISDSSFVWMDYMYNLLKQFYFINKPIPKSILEEATSKLHLQSIFFSKHVDVEMKELMIRSMELHNMLNKNFMCLEGYWKSGGVYFPSDIAQLTKLDSETYHTESNEDADELIMIYLKNVISVKSPSYFGYLKWKYMTHMLPTEIIVFKRNPFLYIKEIVSVTTGNIISFVYNKFKHPVISEERYKIISDTLKAATYDINILWKLLEVVDKTDIRCSFSHPGMITKLNNLVKGDSVTPLEDFTLYNELTGAACTSLSIQSEFISRGGDPSTILDGVEEACYNICYTKEGLYTILCYSGEKNIIKLFSYEKFRDFLYKTIMDKDSQASLNSVEMMILIKSITNSNIDDDKLNEIASYLTLSLGVKYVFSEIPKAVKYIINQPYMKMNYAAIMSYIYNNPKIMEYVPVELVSIDMLMKYMTHANSSDEFRKICTDSVKLDTILDRKYIDSLIMDKGYIQYIPDLSFIVGDDYISKLTEDETYEILSNYTSHKDRIIL